MAQIQKQHLGIGRNLSHMDRNICFFRNGLMNIYFIPYYFIA